MVLLDTNALFLPFSLGIRLDEEVRRHLANARILVPTSVLTELDVLVERKVSHSRLARSLANRFSSARVKGHGDDSVLSLSLRTGAWVVTTDRELQTRLLKAGVPVLVPRRPNRLVRRWPKRVDGVT